MTKASEGVKDVSGAERLKNEGNKGSEEDVKDKSKGETELFDALARRIMTSNPLSIYNGQSWAFGGLSSTRIALRWRSGEDTAATTDGGENEKAKSEREGEEGDGEGGVGLGLGLRPRLTTRGSVVDSVSVLTSERSGSVMGDGDGERDGHGDGGVCEKCDSSKGGRICGRCGFGG